jgi:hypothetical protein
MRYDWRGSLLIVLNFDQKAIGRDIEGAKTAQSPGTRTRAAWMAESLNVLEASGYRWLPHR